MSVSAVDAVVMLPAHAMVTSTSLSSAETAVVGPARKSLCSQVLGKGKLLTSGDSGVRDKGGLMKENKKNLDRWELKNRKYD